MSALEEHPRSLTRQLAVAGVVLGLLQIAVFGLLIGAVRAANDANQRTNRVLGAVQSVSDLEKGVVDCETAVRGFVITGRSDSDTTSRMMWMLSASRRCK